MCLYLQFRAGYPRRIERFRKAGRPLRRRESACRLLWDHRKEDMRWPRCRMINRLTRRPYFTRHAKGLTGIRISIEFGGVAAGHIYSQSMVFQEDVARTDQIDRELVVLAGLKQLRTVCAFAVP